MYRPFWSQVAVVQEGKEPLSHCGFFGMHMPAGCLIKHQQTARSDNNTNMMWRRRDVAIAEKCTGATFSITGEDGAECVEGVDSFNYPGRILHKADEDWPEVLINI